MCKLCEKGRSQLISSGKKNWTGLQLTDVPWYNILANSMESGGIGNIAI